MTYKKNSNRKDKLKKNIEGAGLKFWRGWH